MSAWYLNRLKTMSSAEILFRIFQSCQKQYELLLYKHISPSSELLKCKEKIIDPNLTSIISDNSTFNIFGKEFVYDENEIDWHRDIFSGETFPVIFSKKLNIRINPKASAKNVWEINRLQFLVQIALNYKSTGREYYLTQFVKILTSWIDRNPYLQGINWYSNIEVNIRLINWFCCWEILDVENLSLKNEQFKGFVEKKWIPTIYQHCFYSYNNPSRFSSANNHLISEYAGLFIASSKWEFKESGKWINYAYKGLENEIIKQHSKDGINKEEAAEYIQFITDFFLLVLIVGERTNKPFSEQFKQQLQKIFRYIYDFLDCNGNFPKYGDEDDGKCFILDFSKEFNNFRSLLTSATILFNDPLVKSKSSGFDIKNQFLFGNRGKEVYESVTDINYNEISEFYKEEGHFIFRKNENAKEVYLHFDAAPLGFLSIAAHGHADALSFILHVDGQPIFIDSGTYTYHTETDWRRYFIGTLAHNTICINHKDQAVNGGPTLWIKHYTTSILDLERSESVDRVKATHNGYLKEDAQHIREMVFDKQKNEIQVVDTVVVRNNKKTQVEIPFHFHPEVAIVQLKSDCYMLSRDPSVKVEFFVDEKLAPVVINGQMKPNILGWYSDSFLMKEATSVIYCKTEIDCTTIFKFIIKIF